MTLDDHSQYAAPLQAHDQDLDQQAWAAAFDLKARYFYYVDTQQWERLRTLFSDDATFQGFANEGEGPDAFVQALLTGARSVHQGFMPRLRAVSQTVVRARWSMQDYLTWPPGTKVFRGDASPDLSGIRGYGYYDEEYRRTPQGWMITFIRLTRLRIDSIHGPDPDETFELLSPDPDWLP